MGELNMTLAVPDRINPHGVQIRVMGDRERLLINMSDIASALGCKEISVTTRQWAKMIEGRVVFASDDCEIQSRGRPTTYDKLWCREGDFYRIVLSSGMDAAEGFAEWVCDEVLPCIRLHGCYPAPKEGRPAEMALGQVMAVVLELASEVGTIRQQIEQQQCLAQAVPHSHSASAPRMVREYVREAFWEDCPERVLADIVGTFRTRYQSFYGYWPPNPGGQVACEEDRLRFVEKAFRHHYRKCFPTKQRELTFPEQKQSVQFGGAVVAPLVPPPPANPTLPPPAPPAGPGEHQAVS